jgi:tetratricopeptide (TPR) repeat protein
MSKPMLVTLPFVLVLLDVWPLGRLAGLPGPARSQAGPPGAATVAPCTAPPARARPLAGLIGEKWSLFVLAAVSAVVTFIVQRKGGAVAPLELIPLGRRLANALISCWRYVGQTLWPRDLTVFYPYDQAISIVAIALAAAGLVAVTVAVLGLARKRPYLAVGWLWYLGMLIPVIGLVQVGGQAHADRYTYLPVIGLLVAVVWGYSDLVAGSRPARIAAGIAATIMLAGLALATTYQVALWKNTGTLFTHALAITRDNLVGSRMAHKHLGMALLQSGELRLAIPHLEESLGLAAGYEDSLRHALESNPDDLETCRLLAATLAREDRVEDAVQAYGEILRRNPDDLDALNNVAWMRATHAEARHRDGAEAVRLAERARNLSPQPLGVLYSTLAAAYAEAGRFPEAVRACERAIELAQAAREGEEAKRYAGQLARYRSGRPFHFGD